MSTLEERLVALGAALDLPPAPDPVALATALPERRGRARRRRTPGRRVAAIATALVLSGAGAAFAVPSSRHAILRVLGLTGECIERTTTLPAIAPARLAKLGLGRRIPLADVRRAAAFAGLTTPRASAAYLAYDVPGGRLTLVAGHALIMEFQAGSAPVFGKLAGVATHARLVRVDGSPGVYLSGAVHELFYLGAGGSFHTDRVRLVGNVLVWQRGALTLRIEGTHSLAQALALARTLS